MMHRLLHLPAWLVPALLCVVALLVAVRLIMPLTGSRSPELLRGERMEAQEWRRRVRRLQQEQGRVGHTAIAAHSASNDNDEHESGSTVDRKGDRTLDDVRLTLLESLERAARIDGLRIDDVAIEPAAFAATEPMADDDAVTVLRMTFDGSLSHAGQLIAVLERLASEVSAFPAEVRGCSIDRVGIETGIGGDDEGGIRFTCLFDVIHWPDPWLIDSEALAP